MRHRSRNGQRGSAMLEAALIYGCFMFMLVGALDIGHYMFLHHSLVERTRAATRYGVSRAFDADAIRNIVLYNSPTIPSGASPIFGLSTSNVQVSETPSTLTTPPYLQVTVSGWRYFRFSPAQAGRPTGQTITAMLPIELP